LGLSIGLQSIERFISLQHVENPKLVLIIGCIGLTLNLISAAFLHEHDHGDDHGHGHGHSQGHSHSHDSHTHDDIERGPATPTHASHMHIVAKPTKHGMDLGIMGVLIHVLGDAINNIGVIISALIIWLTESPARFYADPAVSMWIAIMILISAIPLTKRSGKILLQSVPLGVNIDDVKHDLESLPGVLSVHELHVWRLDQKKAVASAHIVVSDPDIESFMAKAKIFTECLHAYGIHSATLQPELAEPRVGPEEQGELNGPTSGTTSGSASMRPSIEKCGLPCGTVCEELKCCK
jgi:zinc transporter 1